MASQSQGPLDLTSAENASTWLIAFNALARSRKWEDNTSGLNVTDNFLAICGLSSLKKLQHIVKPRVLSDMSFSDIELAINEHIRPKKRIVVAERTAFNAISQRPAESVTDFTARLRQAAEHCDFDSLKHATDPTEEMLRVALVAGLHDKVVKQTVLERMHTVDLSVAQIRDIVQHHEQAKAFIERADSNQPDSVEINFTQRDRSQRKSAGSQEDSCNSCGRNHRPRQCPAFGRTCSKCKKRNHFAAVCRSSNPSQRFPKQLHATFDSEESQNEDNFCILNASPAANTNTECLVSVLINDHPAEMQEDTGASVSVLSSKQWNTIGKPPLTKCHSLHAYDGHALKTLGKFSATICINDRFHPIELVVVESDKNFGLLGRDFLEKERIHMTISSQKEVSDKYLPTIKGVKAQMILKEGATPTFLSC